MWLRDGHGRALLQTSPGGGSASDFAVKTVAKVGGDFGAVRRVSLEDSICFPKGVMPHSLWETQESADTPVRPQR